MQLINMFTDVMINQSQLKTISEPVSTVSYYSLSPDKRHFDLLKPPHRIYGVKFFLLPKKKERKLSQLHVCVSGVWRTAVLFFYM